MCKSPIHIPNPNYGLVPYEHPLKNCTDHMIDVPCGYCDECIALKQMYICQRVQLESQKNHVFFCTLTYNNETLPVLNVNGHSIRYFDYVDIQNMFKRLRKSNAFGIPFRFFAVSELGSKHGRPHAHILFFFDKKYFDKTNYVSDCQSFESTHRFDVLKEWRRNIAVNSKGKPDTRHPHYVPLCTYVEKIIRGVNKRNYDFHYVQPQLSENGTSDAAFYCLKYMLKQSPRAIRLQQALRLNLSEQDYEEIWNKVKPRAFKSLGFGLNACADPRRSSITYDPDLIDKLKDDVRFSIAGCQKYPFFFKDDGSTWPMAKYYRDLVVTNVDALAFHKQSSTIDSSELRDHKPFSSIITSAIQFEKIKKLADQGFEDDLEFMFNV